MINEVMAEEVNELCGPKHRPKSDSGHVRAGSSPERVLVDGEREDVVRPRVRQMNASGSQREVQPASYQATWNRKTNQLIGLVVAACLQHRRRSRQALPDCLLIAKLIQFPVAILAAVGFATGLQLVEPIKGVDSILS